MLAVQLLAEEPRRGGLHARIFKEFQGFEVPGSGRKFTELYNVQHLTHNKADPVASVCIGTIQRVYSMLRGDPDLPEELDEQTGEIVAPDRPVEVDYQPSGPRPMVRSSTPSRPQSWRCCYRP